ncbi:hypothetical protein, partial [Klebsiella pneumoniae]|uniref:hypothetical protein n=1 Tax=Klebsiella pneumoniae TaxID=573 RepID=UPI0019688305
RHAPLRLFLSEPDSCGQYSEVSLEPMGISCRITQFLPVNPLVQLVLFTRPRRCSFFPVNMTEGHYG